MFTNKALNDVFEHINSYLEFVGIGTGRSPSKEDILLPDEVIRKQSLTVIDGLTAVKEIYIDDSEGNGFDFTNAGIFFDGADTDVETGSLFAGDVINVQKDNTKSLTVSIEIMVSEG